MNKFSEDYIFHIETFFRKGIKTYADIFQTLSSIFNSDEIAVYFLTPENLRLQACSQKKIFRKIITPTKERIAELFNLETPINTAFLDLKNYLAEPLSVKKSVYGILIIKENKKFSTEEKRLFKTCSLIVSNIIKEIELTEIIKLQAATLQKSLSKSGLENKLIQTENKKIIAADKLKTQFLSNISHELRTPLNSIIGFSELLQNPRLGKLNNKQMEFVKDIQTSGIHLLCMINEILDISKIEAKAMKLTLRNFELNICIEEVLNILKPLYEKKSIKVIKEITKTEITADYQKLQQILLNLINNSIKFTPEHGNITVKSLSKKKYIYITISDTGCGIEKKYHKKIFKKFEQATESSNSTGLGLTITKELVEMHQGKIKIKSEKNKGCEITIKLLKKLATSDTSMLQ